MCMSAESWKNVRIEGSIDRCEGWRSDNLRNLGKFGVMCAMSRAIALVRKAEAATDWNEFRSV